MSALIPAGLILLGGILGACHWRRRKRQKLPASMAEMGWDQLGRSKVIVPNKAKEEWDIREATFLYQVRGLDAQPCYLESNCVSQPRGASSASPQSPAPAPSETSLPDDFMGRLAEKGRNLWRSSECEVTAEGIINKQTGEKGGCIFTVSDIFWITPTDVEVPGGLRISAKGGAIKTYYLKKVDGAWQCVGEHLKALLCE